MGLEIAFVIGLVLLFAFIHKIETTSVNDSEVEDLDLIERQDR